MVKIGLHYRFDLWIEVQPCMDRTNVDKFTQNNTEKIQFFLYDKIMYTYAYLNSYIKKLLKIGTSFEIFITSIYSAKENIWYKFKVSNIIVFQFITTFSSFFLHLKKTTQKI